MKLSEQVLGVLKNSEGHMTAEEMYLYCISHGIKGSMASIYRVLGKLAEEGEIRKVSIPGQPDLFDKTLPEHEHLLCIRCGKVKDIQLKDFGASIAKEISEEIESYDLCIRYICPQCREKEAKKK